MVKIAIVALFFLFFLSFAASEERNDALVLSQYDVLIKTINDETKNITESDVPQSEIELSEKLSIIDNSILNDKNTLINFSQYNPDIIGSTLSSYMPIIIQNRSKIASVNCEDAETSFKDDFNTYNQAFTSLKTYALSSDPETSMSLELPRANGKSWKEVCSSIKGELAKLEIQTRFQKTIDKLNAVIEKNKNR